jgi:hypothetical protein
MSLLMNGTDISTVEVTNISSHGFWLLSHGKEYYLSYEDFPWFQNQTIKSISNVIEESENHLYWPDFDVDLSYSSIINPDKYPLKSSIP